MTSKEERDQWENQNSDDDQDNAIPDFRADNDDTDLIVRRNQTYREAREDRLSRPDPPSLVHNLSNDAVNESANTSVSKQKTMKMNRSLAADLEYARRMNSENVTNDVGALSGAMMNQGLIEEAFDPKLVVKIKQQNCNLCKAAFGFFKRAGQKKTSGSKAGLKIKVSRNNCAKCGMSVCNQCLEAHKIRLSRQDQNTYKVCSSCYAKS